MPPGANRRVAGEDVERGARALEQGRRLMPPDIGLLAALGWTGSRAFGLRLCCFPPVTSCRAAGRSGAGQIYDRRAMLQRCCRAWARSWTMVASCRRSGPDPGPAAGCGGPIDLVLTSGRLGGEGDHVRAAIEAIGS